MHAIHYTKDFFPFGTEKFSPFTGNGKLWAAAAAVVAVIVVSAPHVTQRQEADWLSRLAQSGDSGAQLQLGLAYRDGRDGLAADARTGLYWLERAAQGGDSYAADLVGTAYAEGQGTAVDRDRARHWWQVAAGAGNTDAKHHLGDFAPGAHPGVLNAAVSMVSGKTIRDQESPALQQRAQAGDPVAEYQLAMRYRDGSFDVERNAALSQQWLERAAADGNPVARKTLEDAQGADRG